MPFSFDLDLLAELLGRAPGHLPPHRADPPHLRAARGAAPARSRRASRTAWPAPHRRRAPTSQEQVASSRGFELLAEPEHQLAPLTAVARARGRGRQGGPDPLLEEHGIEIGGGLGPDAPAIWRVGLMGPNARREAADQVLAALDAVLDDTKALAPTA